MSSIAWLVIGAIAGYASDFILNYTLLSGFDLVSIVTAIFGAVVVGVVARWWESPALIADGHAASKPPQAITRGANPR